MTFGRSELLKLVHQETSIPFARNVYSERHLNPWMWLAKVGLGSRRPACRSHHSPLSGRVGRTVGSGMRRPHKERGSSAHIPQCFEMEGHSKKEYINKEIIEATHRHCLNF